MLWQSRLTSAAQDEKLVQQFVAQADSAYREVLAQLKRKEPDLAALSRKYQQIGAEDYFQSALGQQVRDALLSARGRRDA